MALSDSIDKLRSGLRGAANEAARLRKNIEATKLAEKKAAGAKASPQAAASTPRSALGSSVASPVEARILAGIAALQGQMKGGNLGLALRRMKL